MAFTKGNKFSFKAGATAKKSTGNKPSTGIAGKSGSGKRSSGLKPQMAYGPMPKC